MFISRLGPNELLSMEVLNFPSQDVEFTRERIENISISALVWSSTSRSHSVEVYGWCGSLHVKAMESDMLFTACNNGQMVKCRVVWTVSEEL